MGIILVLKFRFAKVVTLAVSIGNQLRPIASRFIAPSLALIFPPEHHKVLQDSGSQACRCSDLEKPGGVLEDDEGQGSNGRGRSTALRSCSAVACVVLKQRPREGNDPFASFAQRLLPLERPREMDMTLYLAL